MPRAYIGVGSNIDPERNISAALRMLSAAVRIVSISTFYRTPAIGSSDSPDFYDGVVAVETDLGPRELKFDVLRKIEETLGRVRCADRNASRTIDLDIEVYGSLAISEPDLVIPDPDITDRAFLALALLELDPAMVLPGTEEKLSEIAESLDIKSIVGLDEFTDELRREHQLL